MTQGTHKASPKLLEAVLSSQFSVLSWKRMTAEAHQRLLLSGYRECCDGGGFSAKNRRT